MGLINPQVEVKMTLARRNHTLSTLGTGTQPPSNTNGSGATASLSHRKDDRENEDVDASLQHHNVFDYGKWFIWCQNCKHGGHASCIDSWFQQQHNVCGVNGCDCKCRKEQLIQRRIEQFE